MDRVRALWESGELRRLALELDPTSFWAAIGLSRLQLKGARANLAMRGVLVPGYLELRGEGSDDAPVDVVPTGHVLKGVSTLVGPDGEIKQQWIKTTAQDDERQVWLDALANMGGDIPRAEPMPATTNGAEDTLACYPLGDPHLGLLAWEQDAGENFDLRIAEDHTVNAIRHLVTLAPASAQALFIAIGDNTHGDGQHNTTTRGTRVDMDGRFPKVVSATLRTFRRSIAVILEKHTRCHVIIERGNHDELIAMMLAIALALYYENEPRVTVDTSPEMFHWFTFGRNLIGTHHGDKVKPDALLGVMAVDRAADWARCPHRRMYCGHYHHQMVKEVPGLIVDYLPTLAGSDAWHRSMGYRSGRATYLDVYHREHGHQLRHVIGIEQVKRLAA